MLGRSVADPYGVESGGEAPGLGLLPVTTILEREKVTRRVFARLLSGPWGAASTEWEAYEIHMGRTVAEADLAPLFSIRREGEAIPGRTDGLVTADGRIWGTYLHGCLDASAVRDALVAWLAKLAPHPALRASLDYRALRESAYDSLAAGLRAALDLPRIRALAWL